MRAKKQSPNQQKIQNKSLTSKVFSGIEITDTHIKSVILSGRAIDQLALDEYNITPLPNGIIQDGRIVDPEQLVATLQQIVPALKSSKSIVSCMPASLITVQTFLYDSLADDDLESIAQFEASQLATQDDISFDYQIIDARRPEMTEVLLAVSKREDTAARIDLFESAGIPLTYLDVESYSIINAFSQYINHTQPDLAGRIVALFDIGDQQTKALFIQNGKLLFKQELSMGGIQLTRDLQRQLQISFEEARDMKATLQSNETTQSIMEAFNETIAQEIQRSLQFFYTSSHSSQDEKVGLVALTGGSSPVAGLPQTVQQKINIQTVVLNPIETIAVSSRVNSAKLKADAGRLTVAYGMAVRGFE